MNQKPSKWNFLISLIIFFLSVPLKGIAQEESLIDTIPLNSTVRHGVLKNGLTYYILSNKDSKKRITLKLIQKVGEYHSVENELGAPHLIEHLALRSTTNFPNGMANSLMALGLRLGSDITAKTGLDATTYEFHISDGDSVLLNYGLRALYDLTAGRLYKKNEVDEERAAVLNEFARANSVNQRMSYLLLDKNPLYTPNLSKEIENYKTLSIETLKNFDQKWYKPQFQAVILVGDFDEFDLEKRVKSIFSKLEAERERDTVHRELSKHYDIPLLARNKLVVFNDVQSRSAFRIEIRQKRKSIMGMSGYATPYQLKARQMDELFNEILKQRRELFNIENKNAFRWRNFIERRTIAAFAALDALVTWVEFDKQVNIKSALTMALTGLEQISRWGFNSAEFNSAKENILNGLRGNLSKTSPDLANELTSHFVDKAAFPEDGIALKKLVLNSINLKEFNSWAKKWISEDGNIDVLLLVPDEKDSNLPNENQIFSWIREVRTSKIKPYLDYAKNSKSFPVYSKGRIADFSRTNLSDVQAEQLLFANNVKVIIKRLGSVGENPNPKLYDVFLSGFRAESKKVKDVDIESASIASDIIKASGIASVNASGLSAWLKNKNKNGQLSVVPNLTVTETGISAFATTNNIDDLFNLVCLYFTKPRKDKIVFQQYLKEKDNQAVKGKTKREILSDTIRKLTTGEESIHENFGNPAFNSVFRFYKDRFSNAGNFTFVITGYFEMEEMINLCASFLGTLPSAPREHGIPNTRAIIENPVSPPVFHENLRVSIVDDSVGLVSVKLLFKGKLDFSVRNALLTTLITKILDPILFVRLREYEKGVYSVNGYLGIQENSNDLILRTDFDALPEDVDRLVAAVRDELDKISRGQLAEHIFINAKETVLSQTSNDSKDAYYLNLYLKGQLQQPKISLDGLRREEILRNISRQDVIDLIRTHIDREHFTLIKLL